MRISDWSSDVCSSDLKQVTVIERHGSDERHWDSQGAGVCMVLRSCSFASAGRSSIARNSLYISGDTEMTRWSRMAFSADFLDASIMKSERERPSMLAARSIRDCVSIRTRRLTAWSGVSEEAVVRGISLILCRSEENPYELQSLMSISYA